MHEQLNTIQSITMHEAVVSIFTLTKSMGIHSNNHMYISMNDNRE